MSPRIALADVSKTYVDRRDGTEQHVFDRFDLEVRPGELVAVVGASGTGKTTLLHLVAGLERPDGGRVEVGDDGRPARLGVVFQQPRLLDWISVRENVALAAEAAGRDPGVVDGILDAVGLADYARSFPSVLSGGQRQRVAVARAFAIDPEVLLFDEPFSALDELTGRKLRLLLQRLWTDAPRTGLLVTHNPLEAAMLADRVVVLEGRPAVVATEHHVDLPRPRDPEDPRLFELHRSIVAELT